MNSFVYSIPTKVYFGEHHLKKLGEELKSCGRRLLLVYGGGSIKRSDLYDEIIQQAGAAELEVFELAGIEPNPKVESVRKGIKICKENRIDMVLAAGGGSVIDASKFIAAGALSKFDPWDFMVNAAPISEALPIITILTLAATGSEMDSIGVLSNMRTNEKVGRAAEPLRPKVSFLDPTLTYSVSRFQTASGAADILSHIMEVYFTKEEDMYMLDKFMEGMMKTVIKYAPVALEKPDDYESRANLMWTSSWAINGFIKAGKVNEWSCHSIEHQLSAYHDITHGLGLAIITPGWMKYCLNEENAYRFRQFATEVFDVNSELDDMSAAQEGIKLLEEFLFKTMGLESRLSNVGVEKNNFDAMAKKACKDGIINGFESLDKEDVKNILEMCW